MWDAPETSSTRNSDGVNFSVNFWWMSRSPSVEKFACAAAVAAYHRAVERAGRTNDGRAICRAKDSIPRSGRQLELAQQEGECGRGTQAR